MVYSTKADTSSKGKAPQSLQAAVWLRRQGQVLWPPARFSFCFPPLPPPQSLPLGWTVLKSRPDHLAFVTQSTLLTPSEPSVFSSEKWGQMMLPMARHETQDPRGPKRKPEPHGANGQSCLGTEAGGRQGTQLTQSAACFRGSPEDPAAKSRFQAPLTHPHPDC